MGIVEPGNHRAPGNVDDARGWSPHPLELAPLAHSDNLVGGDGDRVRARRRRIKRDDLGVFYDELGDRALRLHRDRRERLGTRIKPPKCNRTRDKTPPRHRRSKTKWLRSA